MKIGFFDSGIGGLSVLHLALKRLPDLEYIYYADKKHVPYGEKTREEIIGYVEEIIRFLLDKGADAIVIACNTATSAAVELMRREFSVPIIGMEPAVKKAIDTGGSKKVLVAATPITVNGDKMHGLLERFDKNHLADLVALPGLVPLAERGEFESPEVERYLRSVLEKYSLEDYSSFVLGCTHFNYFKDSLRRVLPAEMKFVDGNEGTVNRLAACLGLVQGAGQGSKVTYYCSGQGDVYPLEQTDRYLGRLERMLAVE